MSSLPRQTTIKLAGVLIGLGVLLGLAGSAQAAIVTWDGGGADNNWNTVANWVGDVAPGTADVATFDATSVKNATVNANISVAGINLAGTYTGTITHAAEVAGNSGRAGRGVLRETISRC